MSISGATPCLWFDRNAEDAATFYVEHFNGKLGTVARYGEGAPLPAGTAMMLDFEILGRKFCALNGGPYYQKTPGISFIVDCDTQEELDQIWNGLAAGGKEMQCGWVTDRFDVSWQVVPRRMPVWMGGGDPAATARVVAAFMPMVKLDIATLEAAFAGKDT